MTQNRERVLDFLSDVRNVLSVLVFVGTSDEFRCADREDDTVCVWVQAQRSSKTAAAYRPHREMLVAEFCSAYDHNPQRAAQREANRLTKLLRKHGYVAEQA